MDVGTVTIGASPTATVGRPMDLARENELRRVLQQYILTMYKIIQTAQIQGVGALRGAGTIGGGGGAATTTTTSLAAAGIDAEELKVMQLLNGVRAQLGLQPLSYNPTLSQAALGHATHMARVGDMEHEGIGDGTAASRVRAVGWRGAWGENIAAGQTTAMQVMADWMNSPTHWANLINPKFDQIAVERVRGVDGRIYWAQNFGTS